LFDKEKFSILLSKAAGNRSNGKLARESGVSRPYISALLNKKHDNPPSETIIRKIASVAFNNITYDELYNACYSADSKTYIPNNIKLLRGNMTYDEFSYDIARKFNNVFYKQIFNPDVLKKYENGELEITYTRIASLALYAQVSEDFFYKNNNLEDFEIAKNEYKLLKEHRQNEDAEVIKTAKKLKDFDLDLDKYGFMFTEEGKCYWDFTKELYEKNISPKDIINYTCKRKNT